jgi:hypothetical protein
MTWSEVCCSDRFRGRWVALDNVRYAAGSSAPAEADVVDADEDLAELCSRMRAADRTSCAILFCEEPVSPTSVRRSTSASGLRVAASAHSGTTPMPSPRRAPRRAMQH